MSGVTQAAERLGKVGIAFLIALASYVIAYLAGSGSVTSLTALVLLVLGIILAFRGLRYLRRHGLWSVRNRLLFVYALIGVLPLVLLFVLIGLTAWGLVNELAVFLATSALDHHLDFIQGSTVALDGLSPEERLTQASEFQKGLQHAFPGARIYVRDETGDHRFPADSPPLELPSGWKNAHGLLVSDHHFYGWCHVSGNGGSITTLAPLSNREIEDLVPNLGVISLIESPREPNVHAFASAGSLTPTITNAGSKNPDIKFRYNAKEMFARSGGRRSALPPALFRFDVPVFLPSTIPHYHLDTPNKTYDTVLWVVSRPSAVFSNLLSNTAGLGGLLSELFIIVAVLFLLVELVAVLIGVRLSRRLTGAVNSLYEGTRRVISGDFGHRIPVRAHDQLGELAQSFNQMTSNLERLLVIEKEKERLQTELEIAREVQSQLYPREAPPTCGLQLTVQCDPARMVSGDYYDYQEIGGGRLAFALGDVAGKGISAALLMATLQASLRAQIASRRPIRENECSETPELDTAGLVSQLNKQIYAHTAPEKYATFFFALFDESTRTLTYTNAGHLSPLLLRNGDVITLDSNGTVVGAFPWAKYDESCLTLEPGDLLICYTDGITEPENAYGEMFGEDRLIDLVKRHAHQNDREIVRLVLDAVRSWTGSPELFDDMTLLLAREVQPA